MTGAPDEGRVSTEVDAAAVRGRVPASPRWRPVRDVNNAAARMLHAGDVPGAIPLLEDAIARTRDAGRSDDGDGEALDLRARALLNLASAREWQGALREALRCNDEGIAAARAAFGLIGDERASRTVALNGRLSRTQTLLALDRAGEALAELDAVEAELTAPDDGEPIDQRDLLLASLHNVRTGVLITLGRLHEAQEQAHRTIAAATVVAPQLAAHAYGNLSAIAQHTGDANADEYLALAEALHGTDADLVSRQLVTENRARSALRHDRDDEAAGLFEEAEAMAREAGLVARIAACRTGSAAILLRRGSPGRAVKSLRGLISELDGIGAVHESREALGFLGDALCALGRYEDAHGAYDRARGLTRSVHERCRVDLRRAETYAEWAAESEVFAARTAHLHDALAIAVPVHLTTEALREDFPAGAARERWGGQVTAPARELAFRLALTVGDAVLLHDLIENAAASATLQADSAASASADDPAPHVRRLFDGAASDGPRTAPPDQGELPAAAAGFAPAAEGGARLTFAPPPRVVPYPGAAPALSAWIDRAEAVYGVRVRSDSVVVSW